MVASSQTDTTLTQSKTSCDLCGLHLPQRPHTVHSNGEAYLFCCTGCRQVFVLLSESGLLEGDFKKSELYQTSLKLGIIGKPDILTRQSEPRADELKDTAELVLRIEGMWCSSCSWLIEKVVGSLNGVAHTRVIYASDTAKIYYQPEHISPERITASIKKLGYATSLRNEDSKEHSSERKSLLIKMGVALFLMKNIMFFSYVLYIGYVQELSVEMKSLIPYILLGLSIPSIFWCGLPIHKKAYRSLLANAPTMELLFSIGIFAAFLYSLYSILTGHTHYYFDTASSLVALLLVGKYVELSAKYKASENINRLYQMLPKKVRIKSPEGERLVSIEKLYVGVQFIVKSGEKIPADGIIVEGRAIIDESLLTGESKPIEKNVGSTVIASSMNVNGTLLITTQRIGKETVLSNIIEMVERALSTKSPLEQTVDKITRVFIPFILTLATGTAIVLLANGSGIETALLRAITILVIACPCALGMATPLAVAAGIGFAAKRGILIRDGATLQRAAKITSAVFDKTGTLTEGKFTLLNYHFGNGNETETLQLLGSLEQASNHPIANAIVTSCKEKGISFLDATEITITDGRGIEGKVNNNHITIGNEQFIREAGYGVAEEYRELIDREVDCGRTVIFFGVDGGARAGYLSFGDSLKAGSIQAVKEITALGISTHLLSGDAERTTSALARLVAIPKYRAQALPFEKIEYIQQLQQNNATVAMVGDGVNDAPALAQADIGIAMGEGTEIAIASSSITLLNENVLLVAEAIDISRRTVRTVTQNVVWAFLYNTVGIVLAVAGLLNPLMAAGAMLASSLSVVANSMRLREQKGKTFKKVMEILVPWVEPGKGKDEK